MKKILISIFTLFVSFLCFSHPGIGIVKDSKGFIYYTDLKNVWKIDPKTMEETIVVPNVHSHELYMDSHDDLYGEHLWYNGEKSDTWGHYVWCLHSDGRLDSVIKPTIGFLENYSFTRDSTGNMYWVQRFKPMSRIQKCTPEGHVTTLVEREFKDIRWTYVSPAGVVYLIDLTDLYKIQNGRLELLAKNLQERTSFFEYGSLRHNIFGIWVDKPGNVYLAVTGGQVVKKITPDGKITDVAYSSGDWRPTGGLFDNDGNLWLLEAKINKARARKIDRQTLTKNPPAITNIINKIRPFLILSSLLCIIIFVMFRIVKKIRRKKLFQFT